MREIVSPLSGIRSPFGPSGRPSFLGASGLWGFTASPTPQFAHFGRSTNKAGALTSGRNGIVRDVDGSGIYSAIPANEASVLAGRGFAGFAALTALNANGNNPRIGVTGWGTQQSPVLTNGPTIDGFFQSVYVASSGDRGSTRSTPFVSVTAGTTYAIKARFGPGQNPSGKVRVFVYTSGMGNVLVEGPIGTASLSTAGGMVGQLVSQSDTHIDFLITVPASGSISVWLGPTTTEVGKDIRIDGLDVTNTAYVPSRWVSTTSPAPTTVADNTTIPDWQAFVERYSLLDGLTIGATVNIRLTPSAARRILTIGTANDGFFLEQTTSNTIRAVLRASSADVWTMTSGAISAAGNRRVQVTVKPGANVLTVEGVTGDTEADATALPDDIRTNPAYVGRDIAGSLHWNGNIPQLVVGKAP